MNSIRNSVQLIGNLGSEVTSVTLENGQTLTKFPLATNEFYNSSEGEKVQKTQWHNIVAWGNKGESMAKTLEKGSEVMIHGKLEYRSYEDKEGVKRYSTEIIANSFFKIG